MKLSKLNLIELDIVEEKSIEGGIIPAVVVAWWAGASLLTKASVISGAAAVVGAAATVGYTNGYLSTK